MLYKSTTYTRIYTQNKEDHYVAKKIDWRIKFVGEEEKQEKKNMPG